MQVILVRECGCTKEVAGTFVNNTLAHLGVAERQSDPGYTFGYRTAGFLAICASTNQQQWPICILYCIGGFFDNFGTSNRIMPLPWWNQINHLRCFFRYILWKLKQHGARLFFLGNTKSLSYQRRYRICVNNLFGHFADRRKQLDNIHNLELALLGFLNRFLTSNHDERKSTKKSVSSWCCEVRGPRAESRETDPCLASKPAICGRHKSGALFMACQNQLDLFRCPQGFQKVEILFTWNAKNILDAFIL